MRTRTIACRGCAPNPADSHPAEVVKTKNKRVYIRVSEQEYDRLASKAVKAKMNMSRFILTAVSDKDITVVSVDGLKEFITELHKIGVNLNQLTRLCNEGRLTCLELTPIRNQVSEIWRSLSSLTQRSTKTKT